MNGKRKTKIPKLGSPAQARPTPRLDPITNPLASAEDFLAQSPSPLTAEQVIFKPTEARFFKPSVKPIPAPNSKPEPLLTSTATQPVHHPSQIWKYPTLSEPLSGDPETNFLYDRVIEINGMPFQRRSDCKYKFSYYKCVDEIDCIRNASPIEREKFPLMNEMNYFRNLVLYDLWFFVYFVMKNPLANHPFIVEACKEVENETEDSLEVWARDHLKTTIISVGRQAQKVLNDPEKRIGLFSASRPLAIRIQNVIKSLFESEFLIRCFPDILWQDASKEAPKWSESPEGGLIVKRKGVYKEATISSWGLMEGMPTGDHYTDILMDDIITQDYQTPEIIEKVCNNFDMAENIGTRDRQITVVGTFYRHDDPLVYIMNKVDVETGAKVFKVRKKTATIDGTFSGPSAFLPEKALKRKRNGNVYFYMCQQLLDPTPRGKEKLNRDHLITVKKEELPTKLYKFMLVDGAGDVGRRKDRTADAWAMMVVGVEPYRDDHGISRIYILDLVIEDMELVKAQQMAVDMYCRNGRILKLAIEKVGMSTTEIHLCGALRAKKRFVSLESGNLQILNPGGRSKQYRIESALSWPLSNGKIHILDSVPVQHSERLRMEMEKFPAWKDDGLDGLSYVYDLLKTYRFGDVPADEKPESFYDRAFRQAQERANKYGWIAV